MDSVVRILDYPFFREEFSLNRPHHSLLNGRDVERERLKARRVSSDHIWFGIVGLSRKYYYNILKDIFLFL